MKKFNKKKLFILKIVYFILRVALIPIVSRKKYNNSKYENILIIDLHLIGDIVLLLPFIEALQKKYYNSNITLLCGSWANSILKHANFDTRNLKIINFNAPWVKKSSLKNWVDVFYLIKELKKVNWDIGFDMRGDFRNSLILNLANVENRVGYDFMYNGFMLTDIIEDHNGLTHLIDYHKNIAIKYELLSENDQFFPTLVKSHKLSKILIGVHLGASMKLRRPNFKNIRNFLDIISSRYSVDTSFVLFKTFEEIEISDFANNYFLEKKTDFEYWEGNLDNFIQKLSDCSDLFCLDSGPAHLAAAFGTNVHIIFGPSSPIFTRPIGENVYLYGINDKPKCWPCEGIRCINDVYQTCYSENLLT